jgi:O-antigen/teichoic acid export membrane protein
MIRLAKKAAKAAGIDLAVKWGLLSQIMRVLTGPVTMVLMLRYLTPDMQGYVYAFNSVLGISIFLELGFSQNILQFASHEYAKLRITKDRSLIGDEMALSRLTSLARLSIKYYSIAAVLFGMITTLGGAWFFRTSINTGVAWEVPWLLACVGSSISLILNPFWALLEGCNQIANVSKFRFWVTFVTFVVTVIAYISGLGLFVGPIVLFITISIYVGYFLIHWRGFFGNFIKKPTLGVISWSKEIWPFQWRIGLSWMSGYLLFSIVVPIIFRQVGPAAAGKYGFTMSLVSIVAGVAATWSTTKLPQYGMLVAQEDWLRLKELWQKSTTHSLLFAAAGIVGMLVAFTIAASFFPQLEERYAGPLIAAILGSCMVVQNFINSSAFLLRAFKKEPYAWLSVIGAIINAALIWAFTWRWGILGAAIGNAVCHAIMFYPTFAIFKRKQLEYMDGVKLTW